MLKLILINIRNTVILLALAYCSIPIISAGLALIQPAPVDRRVELVNYKDVPWAEQHFREVLELKTDFLGYVGWRLKPYAGKTINIDKAQQIRVTPPIPGVLATPATFFFGGSTMLGMGAPDDMTIPAYYQGLSRETAVNYGVSAWAAHQSVNQLMQVMTSGMRPTTVVFYDGVNEIANKCRRENNFYSYSNERSIRDALEYQPTDLGYYWRPVKTATKSAARWLFGEGGKRDAKKFYDCDTDPKKADLVATALLDDWVTAKYVAESHGAHFFAFLQPVAFLSPKTRWSHSEPNAADERYAELSKQFETVYPLIKAKMQERKIGIDISGILDRDEDYFIDFCHVSPNANKIIAEAMKTAIGQSD